MDSLLQLARSFAVIGDSFDFSQGVAGGASPNVAQNKTEICRAEILFLEKQHGESNYAT